jgi:hypothetical protein
MKKSIVRALIGSSMVAALAICLGTATPASAQKQGMRRAQAKQKAEIRNGVKDGKLTKQQAARLSKQENHIKNLEKKDSSDPDAANRAAVKRDMVHEQKAIQADENKTTSTPPPPPSSSTPPLG